ncbi:choice-of-anchor J domain-containing protein [Aquimarina sp. U1-2]|uniref:T9SS-dependent choice-of-anchor J family protein n=1 Tax=Aquimarina sp. U1-2 TaxID=2823141 RepID=UPI001AECBE34|nr:choice-of-anchor J domain-containing protein [Aquimarina sp. U1-2]MBP2832456.1 choice-of-anchor J domain-containing protein [Aquimarina sp. U1-2]
MKLNKKLIVLCAVLYITVHEGFAQTAECGAEPPKDYGAFMLKRLVTIAKTKSLSSPVSLPVQHHVSRNSSGNNPAVSSAEIQNVMDELNTTYAPMNISFYANGPVRFIDNSTWNSSFNKSNDSELRQYEIAEAINIFYFSQVRSGSSSICGYAKFPGTGNRAVLKASCSQNGSTSAHELGHYFSILHTHSTSNGRELVRRTNCNGAGDFFCDTPADPRLSSSSVNSSCNYTGSATDTNGDSYQPDTRNVMSYTRKSCRTGGFTSQQQNAIIASLQSDRAYLLNTTDPTPCTIVDNFPYRQSFESGFGSWSNASGDDINWSNNSGGTPSSGTGPSNAKDGSSYLYTEASTNVDPPGSPNKTAILNSPCIDLSSSSNKSLSFGYHMLGANMGTLEVLISTNDGDSFTSIWSKNGDQGDTWNEAIVDLSSYSGIVKFQFKGITGSSWRSDIAIDDIRISSGTTSLPSTCDGITSYPYRESFEPGFGSWIQETSDDIDWTLDSNTTPSSNTGPSAPSNGDNYAFTEASGNGTGFPNKIALLTSPCIDLTNDINSQLTFDYHMYGSNMGSLEIRISTNDGNSWSTIWSQNGDQGDNWNTQNIDLSAYNGTVVKLQIKGTTGSGFRSDMAIDNLNIRSDSADSDIYDAESTTATTVAIFPNPIASGLLTIQHSKIAKNNTPVQVTITDFSGKRIDIISSTRGFTTYDTSTLSNGVYFVIIDNGDRKITKKLIKQ